MGLIDARVMAPFQSSTQDAPRSGSGMRPRPDRIVLGVRDGFEPSNKSPVRIFLGTEPAQHRATRIFVWSIEQVRDPSRVYEIHMMQDLAGFDRRYWLTGFTNYRYAIPHFAGAEGRAIWNDVDQIYLADPAELFDVDMRGAGFMTIPALSSKKRVDSSVMLMDCGVMQHVWSLRAAQQKSARSLLDHGLAIPGLHGDLDPAWNARDEEYAEDRSKLIHYTVLHTQPWGPIPQRYVYQFLREAKIWYDLEQKADAAGYFVFGPERPSDHFTQLAELLDEDGPPKTRTSDSTLSEPQVEDLRKLCVEPGEQRVLELRLGACGEEEIGAIPGLPQLRVEVGDLTRMHRAPIGPEKFDGVYCTQGLEFLPEADVAWVVEDLFSRSRGFVYTYVDDTPEPQRLSNGALLESRSRGSSWWLPIFERAGDRHPEIHWVFVLTHQRRGDERAELRREGGRQLAGPPKVWLLEGDDAEDREQARILVEALGWPHDSKQLRFTPRMELEFHLTRLAGGSPDLNSGSLESLGFPWPDLVIAAGPRAAWAGRRIGELSEGLTRVVQIDRRAGQSAAPFDIVVSTRRTGLQPHPRRIETLAPLSSITPERLAERAAAVPAAFAASARPHVVLLLGKASSRCELTPSVARRLAQELSGLAENAGGTAFAIVDADAGAGIAEEVRQGFGDADRVQVSPCDQRDGRHAWLASADAIVVAGDNEFRLADAASSGKPVYLYSIPNQPPKVVESIQDRIFERAHGSPLNSRGTVRPQQAIEYLCARTLERGLVAAPVDRDGLQSALFDRKIAYDFGTALRSDLHPSLQEAEAAAEQIRSLLSFRPIRSNR